MGFEKFIKFVLFIVAFLIIYFRNHFYLIVIGIVLFIIYKFKIHKKINDVVNNFLKRTKVVTADGGKKKRFLKKLMKNSGGEI